MEHYCAMRFGEKYTFERGFYHPIKKSRCGLNSDVRGWPFRNGAWCNGELKLAAIREAAKASKGAIHYIGIAADEPIRIERHKKTADVKMPLVEAGWPEQMCREWCEDNGLLSPIYARSNRGGCWFCHNQSVDQLRILRRSFPELYRMMLKWDSDSPVNFRTDGRTLHDVERRFIWEDEGYKPTGNVFRWADTENAQMNVDQWMSAKMDGGEG